MDRRNFLKTGTAAAGLAASHRILKPLVASEPSVTGEFPMRVLGKTGEKLSIIGFGGIVVMKADQSVANSTVARSRGPGHQLLDVAPSYGNAESKLGPALEPYRHRVFLACKTQNRDKAGAAAELESSLKRMRTDHFDLYQLHAMTKMADVDKVFSPDGAMETFLRRARPGRSATSVLRSFAETAIALMDRFEFDSILFPFNFVLFSQANFGTPGFGARTQEGNGDTRIESDGEGRLGPRK